MNSEELKEARERYEANQRGERVYFHESDDGGGLEMCDARTIADAHLAAPQWRAKPTCAGLWAFPATAHNVSWCSNLRESDVADRLWQRPCYGPIPERPAT